MFDECALGVRANVFTTNDLKGKGYHKEQSSLSTTGGHSLRAVVNVGGEIALSGNTPPHQ